ncbi:MAG: B12-binding domain-containing protein, partial [Clostridiales bacterium]|nr:B12-binding domain-containing protein [Clostridiales bacterium]
MSLINDISEKLQQGKKKDVEALITEALDAGVSAREILNDGLLAGMNVAGAKFKANEIFVPEVLIAARAMKAGTELLKSHLVDADVEPVGKVVLGTV